ncbi:unnamed protein product [Paramecium pentaurelia]|uniref:Uncharacterized protein n=1 Tax=Paramecium pentaurelia TaxID=43138 RepID=A0A8S1TGP0_9CILI|nr:unnamed protein product [Paramecium pentaurelia]
MSGELPKIASKSLFSTYVEKKNAEEEAIKIRNRIDQIRQEREKILKRIQAEDLKAEHIYKHRLELQLKKEEKIRQKVEAPPPFSLSVSRAQKETLKKIKEEMLNRKKTEIKEFRSWHRQDLTETKIQKSLDHETYRSKVLQGKEEERQANLNTLAKLKERRDRIRYEVEVEKDRVLREINEYDQKIQELEQLESLELANLQNTLQRQNQAKEKVNLAQSLSPKEFEVKFGYNSTKSNQNQTSQ